MDNIKVSYRAINEVYCLLQAYLREEKIAGTYNADYIEEFVEQIHNILKHDIVDKGAKLEELEEDEQ